MQRFRSFTWFLMIAAFALVLGCKPDSRELVGRGKSAFERGKYEEALENFNAALENDPNNLDALAGIGEVYLKQKKADEAIAAFEDAIAKADNDGAKKSLGLQLTDAHLFKAEDMWRKGVYRADSHVEDEIEKLILTVTETADGKTKEKAYALLISLYDYQFERYRGEHSKLGDGMTEEQRNKELAHIDKVFSTVRPYPEFKRRMRDRVKELTEQAFFAKANEQFTTKIKPVLDADPNVTVDDQTITMVVSIPLSEATLALDLTDPEVYPVAMGPYYTMAKRETVKVTGFVVAGMLGQNSLKQNILPDKVESYTIVKEELFEDMTEPKVPVKMVKITGSISLEEIRQLAFEYQLYLDTEAKLGSATPGSMPVGDGGATTNAPSDGAPADGADGTTPEGPTDGAPADGAPADGAPADGAPADGAPAGGAAPVEGAAPEGATP